MKRMLHLGCGPIHFPNVNGSVEWINIDKEPSSACDICEDYLTIDAIYRENTIDAIYSCHSIEHLEYPAGVVKFFQACFKVLQPGGTLRVVVPDLQKICAEYLNGSDMKFIHGSEFPAYYYKAESAAERVHFFVSGKRWEHQICFDLPLLEMLMRDVGFEMVILRQFNESPVSELRGIDRFESESLCVEANKP